MILRGAQIHRNGDGQCGLLSNPTLSSKTTQLPFSSVPANTTIQEQLGAAILHVTHAQTGSEEIRAAQQEQLASLVLAAVHTEAQADRLTLLAAVESHPEGTTVGSTEPASWPEIPMGYLSVAGLMLVTIFFGGLSLAARSRETKALAEMEHQTTKWVYRLAA
jgi:hypothetical protein